MVLCDLAGSGSHCQKESEDSVQATGDRMWQSRAVGLPWEEVGHCGFEQSFGVRQTCSRVLVPPLTCCMAWAYHIRVPRLGFLVYDGAHYSVAPYIPHGNMHAQVLSTVPGTLNALSERCFQFSCHSTQFHHT